MTSSTCSATCTSREMKPAPARTETVRGMAEIEGGLFWLGYGAGEANAGKVRRLLSSGLRLIMKSQRTRSFCKTSLSIVRR